ncbi:MAG: hypothetical protein KF857_00035 [Fimbriimonadaceae bacterium]|nr:hypothetical protein [Fimbriimonadaceae bacterium]
MPVATCALAMLAIVQAKDMRTYRDESLGLEFQHPKAWAVRKERLFSVIEFKTKSGQPVKVQIIDTAYRSDAEKWQSLQRDISETSKRQVLKQWTEELLGVPLLLTRTSEVVGAETRVTLIGLLYSRTAEKLNFRVSSSAAASDEAEAEWRSALLTIRTVSGVVPKAEAPGTKVETPVKPTKPKSETVWNPKLQAPPKTGKATNRQRVEKWDYYMPEGWTVTGEVAKHAGLKGTVTLRAATGNAVQARNSWLRIGGVSLAEFTKVDHREETAPYPNRAGVGVLVGRRWGQGTAGPLYAVYALGWSDDKFWLLDYRAVSKADYEADKDLVQDLIDRMSVETVL